MMNVSYDTVDMPFEKTGTLSKILARCDKAVSRTIDLV